MKHATRREICDLDSYRIANARIPAVLLKGISNSSHSADLVNCNLVIERGRLTSVEHSFAQYSDDILPLLDLDNGIVLPRFVDIHTHLDRGHIWFRAPNPDGSFVGARAAATIDMEAWNADDVRARMNFSLRCAFAHGTGAIRTHLDWVQKPSGLSWSVFREMREEWRGKIELQAAALFPIETAIDDEEQFLKVIETVAAHEGVLGGVACLDEPPGPKLEAALDRVFDAAIANGFDLDLHVDETLRTTAFSLELIANAAIRHCFRGKLVVGHCCSLALVSEETRDRVVALLADAKISVVSLPMCNMYLQDRTSGRTPRLRGVAPVHELDAGGVRIMIGSDNVQDPFYPYGDLDMLEVYREATRILHLDHSNRPWLRALGVTAAEIMGLTACREICPGQDADFVLTSARTIPELLSRPQSDRMVLVAGRAINSAPPDYRELDPAASRDIT